MRSSTAKRGAWTLVVASLATADPACAQPSPFVLHAPEVVDLAASRIAHPGDSGAWRSWHSALDRLVFEGEGQVSVVHIGGSHLQADIWSQRARHRLQTMLPGLRAGRGMAFPYALARTNNPWWYTATGTGTWTAVRSVTKTDTSTIGLSGISLTTHDTLATITLAFRTDPYPGHSFDRVQVLHRTDSAYSATAVVHAGTVERTVDTLAGRTVLRFSLPQDTLRLLIRRTDTLQRSFTLHGLVLESDDPGVVYHSVGANGANTASYLRCQRFTNDLALLRPQLVILSIGVNDTHDAEFSPARFKHNYADLVARVRQAAPGCAILLTTVTDNWFRRRVPNRKTEAARQAILELAAEEGLAVWDLFTVMGGLGSMARWEKAGLAQRDRIHLNRAGYELLGDLMFTALMEDYSRHIVHHARP